MTDTKLKELLKQTLGEEYDLIKVGRNSYSTKYVVSRNLSESKEPYIFFCISNKDNVIFGVLPLDTTTFSNRHTTRDWAQFVEDAFNNK